MVSSGTTPWHDVIHVWNNIIFEYSMFGLGKTDERWGGAMREALQAYVKRIGELAEHVRGNEQATKQSLVGPLFTTLGYDLTDPRECLPEYRVNFGPNRSVGRVDPVCLQNGHPIFAVQAKASALDLAGRSRPRDPSDGCRMGLRPPTGGGGRADVTASWRRTFRVVLSDRVQSSDPKPPGRPDRFQGGDDATGRRRHIGPVADVDRGPGHPGSVRTAGGR